jgi:uncharacterized membrane protein
MNDKVMRMAREAEIHVYPEFEKAFERFANLIRADERDACARDADWCIQNHLEHLIPERIRARIKA